jgi:hypothetical protein
MKKSFLLFLFGALSFYNAFAQDTDLINNAAELIGENSGENGEADIIAMQDEISRYQDQQLDLNSATEEELLSAPFLSNNQAEAILRYRIQYGTLLTVYELIYTGAFTADEVERLMPLVSVKPKKSTQSRSFRSISKLLRYQFLGGFASRIEDAQGYKFNQDGEAPNYAGDKYKAMFRYRMYASNWFSAGITTEKDPGEKWLKNGTPDFVSAHFFYKPDKFLQTIALGDYSIRIGQGLIFWNGFSFGKYSFPSSVIRYNQGVSGFTGADESRFLRGAAAIFRYKKLDVTILASFRNLDANVSATDSSNNPIEVSSVSLAGTHATENQLKDRHVLGETMAATHLKFRTQNFEIGATAGAARYSLPLVPGAEPYRYYYFSGKSVNVAGADYRFVYKEISVAGEVAHSFPRGLSTVHLLRAEPLSGNSFAIAYRYYSPEYQGLRPMSFGENNLASNELGWTIGTELAPFSMIRISAMADVWKHPWLRYRINSPSQGKEYRISLKMSPKRWIENEIRYRYRNRPLNLSGFGDIPFPERVKWLLWMASSTFLIGNHIKTSFRFYNQQYWATNDCENGYYVCNDWFFDTGFHKLRIGFRQGWFHTDGYNSRIYAYEFDTPWSYSIPFLSGKGSRTALMLSGSPVSSLMIYLKAGYSYYPGQTSTGSGDNLTQGPRQTEVHVHVCWKIRTPGKVMYGD